MIMDVEITLKVGDRVEHADAPGSVGVIECFFGSDQAVVRWESTGRESSERWAYLKHADS